MMDCLHSSQLQVPAPTFFVWLKKKKRKKIISVSLMARNYNSQNGSNIMEIKKGMTWRRARFERRFRRWEESRDPGWVRGQRPKWCLEFKLEPEGTRACRWRKGVWQLLCVPLPVQWDPWETRVTRPPVSTPTPPITVPFKATQHLFPPIKTNNLFCRKSQQLSSAGARARLDGL